MTARVATEQDHLPEIPPIPIHDDACECHACASKRARLGLREQLNERIADPVAARVRDIAEVEAGEQLAISRIVDAGERAKKAR